MTEPKIHTHDEALDAICGCAVTVTVLSYQEAIEGYFSLRGWPHPAKVSQVSEVAQTLPPP